uniref:Uncharacterized protein n=1 Tax=Arundo donax TaxID=35708 RepID=A0A0A8YGE2_ARUDO
MAHGGDSVVDCGARLSAWPMRSATAPHDCAEANRGFTLAGEGAALLLAGRRGVKQVEGEVGRVASGSAWI